jgi:uncharacterized coiled-coil DUF342 family protein
MTYEEWKVYNQIQTLKGKFDKTDYIASKLAEAIAKDMVLGTTEHTTAVYNEYAELIRQRDEWRAEINRLEAELGAMKTEVK